MRLHIGFHILTGGCGQERCGFCGRSCECSVDLKITKKARVLISDCPYFSLKSAETISEKAPCTNRPVGCQACNKGVWSHNMAQHWTKMHPGHPLPPDFEINSREKESVICKGRMWSLGQKISKRNLVNVTSFASPLFLWFNSV